MVQYNTITDQCEGADMIHLGTPAHAAVLTVHIGFGVVGLATGFGALALRKGGRLHRVAGKVFFPAMLVMLLLGGVLFTMEGKPFAWLGIGFGLYLTASAWIAARYPDGIGRYGLALTLGAGVVAAASLILGVLAFNTPDGPLGRASFALPLIFALLAALGGGYDYWAFRRGGVTGPPRVRRHIWRVAVTLFIATGSFFLGQQDEFPKAIQGPIWWVPALAPLVLMIFWLWRYRDRKRRSAPPAGAAPEPA
jgi:hypothetical protein